MSFYPQLLSALSSSRQGSSSPRDLQIVYCNRGILQWFPADITHSSMSWKRRHINRRDSYFRQLQSYFQCLPEKLESLQTGAILPFVMQCLPLASRTSEFLIPLSWLLLLRLWALRVAPYDQPHMLPHSAQPKGPIASKTHSEKPLRLSPGLSSLRSGILAFPLF